MLTDVVIEDYQAVREASLRLGKFTVVTGPTGSGKSAVIRAVRLCAFNARGTGYVRHGAKSCQVALHEEQWSVSIQRGSRGKDAYRIASAPGDFKELTKLAGAVPDEVTALLRLGDINFAGQFDRPFLLAESGGQVARVLGELTNVTLVFDAAREANRRKLELARELRGWEKTLVSLREQAQSYRTLKDRREAAVEAAERHGICRHLAAEAKQLGILYDRWYRADLELGDLEAGYSETVPPSAQGLDRQLGRLNRLSELRVQRVQAGQSEGHWQAAADAAGEDEKQAHADLHRALLDAGTCPTCGREMSPDD